jgi:hypothetical protein
MARLVVITALLIWSFASQPLLAADGCPYLTNAEVEAVTERELELFKLSSMPLPDGAGTACDSSIVRVIVLVGENAVRQLDDMMKSVGRDQEEHFPVADLGEAAYALHLEPRNENEYPTALVVVTSASYTLGVSVRAKDGEAAATAVPQAVELAKLALTRVD